MTVSLKPLIAVLSIGLPLAGAACNYSFGAGSFPPKHINSVAVLPFENETDRFELTQEVHQVLLQDLPRALGVRNAAEDNADAVVRGTIHRYDLTAPLYRSGEDESRAEVLQREVSLGVQVEIVDLIENVVLWESTNLLVRGQYLEDSETEEIGRTEAIELLVQRIIDGAQSQLVGKHLHALGHSGVRAFVDLRSFSFRPSWARGRTSVSTARHVDDPGAGRSRKRQTPRSNG